MSSRMSGSNAILERELTVSDKAAIESGYIPVTDRILRIAPEASSTPKMRPTKALILFLPLADCMSVATIRRKPIIMGEAKTAVGMPNDVSPGSKPISRSESDAKKSTPSMAVVAAIRIAVTTVQGIPFLSGTDPSDRCLPAAPAAAAARNAKATREFSVSDAASGNPDQKSLDRMRSRTGTRASTPAAITAPQMEIVYSLVALT